MSLKPKVALSNDFLLQLAKLPAKVHSKVMKWAIQIGRASWRERV